MLVSCHHEARIRPHRVANGAVYGSSSFEVREALRRWAADPAHRPALPPSVLVWAIRIREGA